MTRPDSAAPDDTAWFINAARADARHELTRLYRDPRGRPNSADSEAYQQEINRILKAAFK